MLHLRAAALLVVVCALAVTIPADGVAVLNDCKCQCPAISSTASFPNSDSTVRVKRRADEDDDDFGVGQINIPGIKGLSRANDVSVNSHNGGNGFAATGAGGVGGYSVINNYGTGSVSSHSNGAVINRKQSRWF